MIKFLIIRLSSIGDIVLTTPIVRIIQNQIQDSEIHFLTKEQYLPIIKENPHISKIHLLSKNNFDTLISELINENFEYVIDLHNNIRTNRIINKLKVVDFKFNKLNVKKWILVNFKKNLLPNLHIVDRYLDTLNVFDIKNDNKGLEYFYPENEHYDISSIFENNEKRIILIVGAKHFTKRIPKDKALEILKKLNKKIILLGGKDDIETARFIELGYKNIINLTGKLSINQSASVIKQSDLVISSDTGLMHIAAAYKKIIISLWGNTVPEFGMYPYLPDKKSKIFEVKKLKCRPCSKIGFKKCPKKHFKCMYNINTNNIVDYIENLFAN